MDNSRERLESPDHSLENLLSSALRSADAALPAPRPAAGLARRVRRRARRQSAVRAAATAGVALAVGLGALLTARQLHPGGLWFVQELPIPAHPRPLPGATQPVPAFDVAAAKAEYARLDREAESHAKTIAVLLQERVSWKRRERALEQLAKPGVTEVVAAQRDRAAKALVDLGDALSAGSAPSGRAQAADAYREAAEHFPASPEAEVARRRLEQIKT